MGLQMARPRTPTALLDARGAFKKDPQRKRENEPVVKEPVGHVPDGLEADEVKAYQQLVSDAPMGVLTKADTVSVELAACLLAEFRRDRGKFSPGKLGRLESILGQFGMTPSKRASLGIEKPKRENPFDAL